MIEKKVNYQKRAQRESLIRKELSKLFLEIKLSDENLKDIFINNVQLSSDKSTANILFFSLSGEEHFEKILPFLILYKPSMRKALSRILDSRYTPQIVFRYDKTCEKQAKIEALLDKLKTEDPENQDLSDNNIDNIDNSDTENNTCNNSANNSENNKDSDDDNKNGAYEKTY